MVVFGKDHSAEQHTKESPTGITDKVAQHKALTTARSVDVRIQLLQIGGARHPSSSNLLKTQSSSQIDGQSLLTLNAGFEGQKGNPYLRSVQDKFMFCHW